MTKKTFEQIAERATSIAFNLEEKTSELGQKQKKKDSPERHEDIETLADLSKALRRISSMSEQARNPFDVMYHIGAIHTLHARVEDFESRIERGRKKG